MLMTLACICRVVSEDMTVLCSAGTASVIIALTDGELNEWQFDTAQREVRCEGWTKYCERLMKRDLRLKSLANVTTGVFLL